MGCSLAECQQRVTAREFAGWQAAAELGLWFDPWAAHGELIATILSAIDGKRRHGWKFYPGGRELHGRGAEMSDAEIEAAMEGACRARAGA